MPDPKPGNGFFGWLGRQVGHVKKAVQTDVVAPADKVKASLEGGCPQPPVPQPSVIYRNDRVEEAPHPQNPALKLRRTVIDEVIVEKKES